MFGYRHLDYRCRTVKKLSCLNLLEWSLQWSASNHPFLTVLELVLPFHGSSPVLPQREYANHPVRCPLWSLEDFWQVRNVFRVPVLYLLGAETLVDKTPLKFCEPDRGLASRSFYAHFALSLSKQSVGYT